MLEKWFELKARKTSVSIEFRGAVATFLTMAYILVANPLILNQAGIPFSAAVAATALAAALSCFLMGFVANFPLALASGMGLNSMLAFTLVPALGSWEKAMGLVVLDGLLILILVLCGMREAVLNAIPKSLRLSIGAGIGLFIAFIGLVNAKLVVVPQGTLHTLIANPKATLPPVQFGNINNPECWLSLLGVILILWFMVKRVRGAIILGIALNTIGAYALGLVSFPNEWSAPDFSTLGKADVFSVLKWSSIPLLLSLVMVDFFDTLGTVTAISEEANLVNKQGTVPRLTKILAVDSMAAAIGGLFGASSVTSYIESAAGVAEGARSGLHSVFVGLFFLASLLIAPLVSHIPACATSPALIIVGFLMMKHIREINFDDLEEGIPAFLTFLTIPLTFSISHGIGLGIISYVAIKVLTLKFKQIKPILYFIAAAFVAHFLA